MTEKDYIKSQLDLLKIAITSFIGSIFVLGFYNAQTFGANPIVSGLMVLSFILLLILLFAYGMVSNRLKEPKPPQAATEPITETKERKYPDIWEIYITIAAFFFAIYPVARDYVEKPETFNGVLFLALIWLLIFIVGAIIGVLIFKKIKQ